MVKIDFLQGNILICRPGWEAGIQLTWTLSQINTLAFHHPPPIYIFHPFALLSAQNNPIQEIL